MEDLNKIFSTIHVGDVPWSMGSECKRDREKLVAETSQTQLMGNSV